MPISNAPEANGPAVRPRKAGQPATAPRWRGRWTDVRKPLIQAGQVSHRRGRMYRLMRRAAPDIRRHAAPNSAPPPAAATTACTAQAGSAGRAPAPGWLRDPGPGPQPCPGPTVAICMPNFADADGWLCYSGPGRACTPRALLQPAQTWRCWPVSSSWVFWRAACRLRCDTSLWGMDKSPAWL